MHTSPDSEALTAPWKGFLKGDERCCETLFRSCYADLYGYGLRLAGDEEMVRDAIQDLFATLWQRRHRLGPVASVRAYLFSALRRLLLRRLRRERRGVPDYRPEPPVTFGQEEVLIAHETSMARRRALHAALDHLSPRQREVLHLRYAHGLTGEEVADVLGLGHQTVRNHLSRALAVLRTHCNRLVERELTAVLALALLA